MFDITDDRAISISASANAFLYPFLFSFFFSIILLLNGKMQLLPIEAIDLSP